jgi:hypothetical protein
MMNCTGMIYHTPLHSGIPLAILQKFEAHR